MMQLSLNVGFRDLNFSVHNVRPSSIEHDLKLFSTVQTTHPVQVQPQTSQGISQVTRQVTYVGQPKNAPRHPLSRATARSPASPPVLQPHLPAQSQRAQTQNTWSGSQIRRPTKPKKDPWRPFSRSTARNPASPPVPQLHCPAQSQRARVQNAHPTERKNALWRPLSQVTARNPASPHVLQPAQLGHTQTQNTRAGSQATPRTSVQPRPSSKSKSLVNAREVVQQLPLKTSRALRKTIPQPASSQGTPRISVQPRPSSKNKSLDQLSHAPSNDPLPPLHPSAPAVQVQSSSAEAFIEILNLVGGSTTRMTSEMLELRDAVFMLDAMWKVSIISFDIVNPEENWQDLPEESQTMGTVRQNVNALGMSLDGSGNLSADALELLEMFLDLESSLA
jgi:hypothetical protein